MTGIKKAHILSNPLINTIVFPHPSTFHTTKVVVVGEKNERRNLMNQRFAFLALTMGALYLFGHRSFAQEAAKPEALKAPKGSVSYVAKDGAVTIDVKDMEADGTVLLHPLENGVMRVFAQSTDGNTTLSTWVTNASVVTLKGVRLPLREVKEDGKEVVDPAQRTWTLSKGVPLPKPDAEAETTITGDTVWTKEKPRELVLTAGGRTWTCTTPLLEIDKETKEPQKK